MRYRIKCFLISFKYSFLKLFGWEDCFHSHLIFSGDVYSVYVYGKKFKKARIKKYPEEANPPEGVYPWYVELENGDRIHIISMDVVLFLPWCYSKEGKKYLKERRKKWSIPQ